MCVNKKKKTNFFILYFEAGLGCEGIGSFFGPSCTRSSSDDERDDGDDDRDREFDPVNVSVSVYSSFY